MHHLSVHINPRHYLPPRSMRAGLDALPDDVLLQLIKACSRDTPDAGGMPELEVSSVLPPPAPAPAPAPAPSPERDQCP